MPTKNLSLSIVIPVYNEQHYLKACLEAVAKQTISPDEVIVVDNNSTDRTIKIAQSFPFVKVLKEKKQGVMYARNTGFAAAKSDIIGRIDADTVLEPDWIARAKQDFKNPGVAAITGSSHWYDMPLAPHSHWVEHAFKGFLYKYAKDFPFLFGTNMAIRRSEWQAIRSKLCQKNDIFEDADLAIHLTQSGKHILYDIKLRAGMSSRRYTDEPRNFYHYIRQERLTYLEHGIRSYGSHVAMMGYLLGYVVLWPLHKSYDYNNQQRSLKHFIRGGSKPRPHPMD